MIFYKGLDTTRPDGKGRSCIWFDNKKIPPEGPFYLPDFFGHGLDWGSIDIAGRKVPRKGCDALALALCAAILDETDARKVYKIFQFRHVNALPDVRWSITHGELRRWVGEVVQALDENRRIVARAPSERVAFERETGVGANGLPVRWDSDDHGRIIPATDPDDMTWSPAPYRRGL